MGAVAARVLAMVGFPGFDPEKRVGLDGRPFSNFAIRGMYEPGSTQKLITFAAGLDTRVEAFLDIVESYRQSGARAPAPERRRRARGGIPGPSSTTRRQQPCGCMRITTVTSPPAGV